MQTFMKELSVRPGAADSSAAITVRDGIREACEADGPETESLLLELDRLNRILGVYRTLERVLMPWCAAIAKREGCVRLIDSGCGSGGLLLRLQRELYTRGIRARLLGLDPNPAAIRGARRNYETLPSQRGPGAAEITFECGTLQDLPRTSTDLIISTFVLHHLPDAAQLDSHMREIRRVAMHGTFHLDFREHPHWLLKSAWLALLAGLGCSQALRQDGADSVARAWSAAELTGAARAAEWEPRVQGVLGICRTVRGEFLTR